VILSVIVFQGEFKVRDNEKFEIATFDILRIYCTKAITRATRNLLRF